MPENTNGTIAQDLAGITGNTKLIRLARASALTGCDIYGKAGFMNPGGSVKDRAADAIITAAERDGLIAPGGTIVEGSPGNTGIALTLLAHARGYRSTIVMPQTQSQEKIDTLRMIGAELRLVPARPFHDPGNYVHVARRLAAETGAFHADQFENPANRAGHRQNGTLYKGDQSNGVAQYAYNAADILQSYTDPLSAMASYYYYDLNKNLTCIIDRRGNQANFTYDLLNRRSGATYYIGDTSNCSGTPGTVDSTISYGYDHGNRLLTVTDSAGGTITRQSDDIDRLSSDAQAAAGSGNAIGTVTYGYDAGSRLTAMTPSTGVAEAFAYDPANRLTAITRAADYVCMTYDQANRRKATVLPNLLPANNSVDVASDLTQIAYLSRTMSQQIMRPALEQEDRNMSSSLPNQKMCASNR